MERARVAKQTIQDCHGALKWEEPTPIEKGKGTDKEEEVLIYFSVRFVD